MFSTCCGCRKNTVSGKPKVEPVEFNQEIVTKDTNQVITKDQICDKAIDRENDKKDCDNPVSPKSSTHSKIHIETPRVSVTVVTTEDGDSDEVFAEGVGAPIPLATNLATPHPCKRDQVTELPQWFSEDNPDSVENCAPWCSQEDFEREGYTNSGLQEPPATPIGKDELALRRHRFFSELISVSRPDSQHRVRFDPFGPLIAPIGGVECECVKVSVELESLVTRLEDVTSRLEKTLGQKSPCTENLAEIENMSVNAFHDIVAGPLAQFLKLSREIGGEVAAHSGMVEQAFQAQLKYVSLASASKAPSKSDEMELLRPTSNHIGSIQSFREKNRTSPFFNHLSAVSESIPALGWVTVAPAPAPYVKEMNDAGQFYTNRVLKEWKEKDKKHVEWVKAWIQTLTELQQFVKQHHTTGLVWSGKGGAALPPPPPPPACPPPMPAMPPMPDFNPSNDDDRSALFAQINQGEDITKSLKKVTSDMQTHKNAALRTGPAPFKAPTGSTNFKPVAASVPLEKAPNFVRDGKKWLIEYQKGNHNLLVENAEMGNVVYLYKCTDSTLSVKGKINSITLDSCKKTSVVFDTLVSAIEFINCQSVQMQVLGKVATVSIDKTDGCQIYLSQDSLNVEIISSKSSEMNVMIPQSNGDYLEYPVPEQYKTTVVPGKGLQTIIVESKG